MNYTNNHNLPEAIYKAIVNQDYDKGDADLSVTGLISPVQIQRLMSLHGKEVTIDVSEEIMALLGTGVHYILERALLKKNEQAKLTYIHKCCDKIRKYMIASQDNDEIDFSERERKFADTIHEIESCIENNSGDNDAIISEERFYFTVGDYVISGKPDWYNQETGWIEDYKVTSTYKIMKGDYSDWTYQLNCYAHILRSHGFEVKGLKINAILRDWKPSEAKRNENYPKGRVAIIELPLMKPIDILLYMANRVKIHQEAKELPEDQLPECSEEDRWAKPATFAVMKNGSSRASKVFESEEEAQGFASSSPEYYVQKRGGESLRCEEYCKVKDFCKQYARMMGTETKAPVTGIGELSAPAPVIIAVDELSEEEALRRLSV